MRLSSSPQCKNRLSHVGREVLELADLKKRAAFIWQYASMAASRDRASALDSAKDVAFRFGTDIVHIEMSDARVGERKGCDDCWRETGAIVMLAMYASCWSARECIEMDDS
jgi:hypothetical protein